MIQVTKVWWDGEKLMAEPIDPTTIHQEPAQEKDWGAVGEAHIAAIKKSSKAMVEDAAVRAVHKVMAEFEAKSDGRLMEPPAQQEPEFFTHCVDQPYDWSEWVCPDPKGYLMKCCDCGLVHEAEFGVVRYKSETEREDCDMVDDPNLQAVFRMRRSEQWSPADTAHRAGGLTMEQPAQQEPVAWRDHVEQRLRTWRQSFVNRSGDQLALDDFMDKRSLDDLIDFVCDEYTSPPAQRKPLTDEQIDKLPWGPHEGNPMTFAEGLRDFARAIEAAHGIGEKK